MNPGTTISHLQRILLILALPACLLLVEAGHAHPGHPGALTTEQAVARGRAITRSLVEKGEPVNGEVLDESWNEFEGRTSCGATPHYYRISLENYAARKTLYVLLNHSGRFLRARFDAGFAELKFSPFPVLGCDQR